MTYEYVVTRIRDIKLALEVVDRQSNSYFVLKGKLEAFHEIKKLLND